MWAGTGRERRGRVARSRCTRAASTRTRTPTTGARAPPWSRTRACRPAAKRRCMVRLMAWCVRAPQRRSRTRPPTPARTAASRGAAPHARPLTRASPGRVRVAAGAPAASRSAAAALRPCATRVRLRSRACAARRTRRPPTTAWPSRRRVHGPARRRRRPRPRRRPRRRHLRCPRRRARHPVFFSSGPCTGPPARSSTTPRLGAGGGRAAARLAPVGRRGGAPPAGHTRTGLAYTREPIRHSLSAPLLN